MRTCTAPAGRDDGIDYKRNTLSWSSPIASAPYCVAASAAAASTCAASAAPPTPPPPAPPPPAPADALPLDAFDVVRSAIAGSARRRVCRQLSRRGSSQRLRSGRGCTGDRNAGKAQHEFQEAASLHRLHNNLHDRAPLDAKQHIPHFSSIMAAHKFVDGFFLNVCSCRHRSAAQRSTNLAPSWQRA